MSVTMKCIHRYPPPDEIVTGIEFDPLPNGYRVRKSSATNLRIHFDYSKNFITHPEFEKIKNQILMPAKNRLERLLKVKNPNHGILRVNRACKGGVNISSDGVIGCAKSCATYTKCMGITIPEQYLKRCRIIDYSGDVQYSGKEGSGIPNVDIVMIVAFTSCNDNSQANAASCFSEINSDRPIFGVIEMCTSAISANKKIKESINIVTHEIIHALGFSIEKFAFYRYSNGDPIVPRNNFGKPSLGINFAEKYYNWNDKIIKNVSRKRESIHGVYYKSTNAFVLENVVNVARKHFKCASIDSVDIEDAGGSGSANTHFDEYFLHNEIMTPLTNNAIDVISKFTLALLKDTGWYDVNYSNAEYLEYGTNKGCTLPLYGCYRYMEEQRQSSQSLDPFCERVFQFGNIAKCSNNRDYYDYCHLTNFNSVLKNYQYFHKIPGVKEEDTEFYAGNSEFNEYCPTNVIFTSPNSICSDESNFYLTDKYNIINSYYGKDSMCFENGLVNDLGNVYYGASCQKYSYDSSKSTYFITIGSKTFTCPSKNSLYFMIDSFFNVSLNCPSSVGCHDYSISAKILLLIYFWIFLFYDLFL